MFGPCHTNGDCFGPGSYCCAHTGPHTHDEGTYRLAPSKPHKSTLMVTGVSLDVAMSKAQDYSELLGCRVDVTDESGLPVGWFRNGELGGD